MMDLDMVDPFYATTPAAPAAAMGFTASATSRIPLPVYNGFSSAAGTPARGQRPPSPISDGDTTSPRDATAFGPYHVPPPLLSAPVLQKKQYHQQPDALAASISSSFGDMAMQDLVERSTTWDATTTALTTVTTPTTGTAPMPNPALGERSGTPTKRGQGHVRSRYSLRSWGSAGVTEAGAEGMSLPGDDPDAGGIAHHDATTSRHGSLAMDDAHSAGHDGLSHAHPGERKKVFSMGFRSDCERCVRRESGHFSHLL